MSAPPIDFVLHCIALHDGVLARSPMDFGHAVLVEEDAESVASWRGLPPSTPRYFAVRHLAVDMSIHSPIWS